MITSHRLSILHRPKKPTSAIKNAENAEVEYEREQVGSPDTICNSTESRRCFLQIQIGRLCIAERCSMCWGQQARSRFSARAPEAVSRHLPMSKPPAAKLFNSVQALAGLICCPFSKRPPLQWSGLG